MAKSITYTGTEPVVTVWRNKIPHGCTLIYGGRKWIFSPGNSRVFARNKRWIPRRVHVWSAHAPIDGAETVAVENTEGWHEISHYHADGSMMILGDDTEVPGA